MDLRGYQVGSVERVRAAMRAGARRVILCLPTGSGKTVVAAHIIAAARGKQRRTLFLAHRRELIFQCSEKLERFGVPHGIVLAGVSPTESLVQVGSIQTLCRRKHGTFDFVFVDEAHHTTAKSYLTLLERCGDPWVVGLTATPYRTDGAGLGKYYSGLVGGPSVVALVEAGHLVPVDIYAPPMDAMHGAKKRAGDFRADELTERMDRPRLIGDIVSHWRRLAQGRQTIVFCVSIAHSRHVAAAFAAAGIRAAHLDGETPREERAEILGALAKGSIAVVCNCAVLTEGFDCPQVGCAVIARPTLSRGLWTQMAGRILRPHPGKDRALILDHGGCARRHGHIYEPQVVDIHRGLEERPTKSLDNPASMTRICSACSGVSMRGAAIGAWICPHCGALNRPKPREQWLQEDGRLRKLEWENAPHSDATEEQKQRALEKLLVRQEEHDYKRGWIWFQLKIRYGDHEATRLLGGR